MKLRSLKKFLEKGEQVNLVVLFRGREIVHPELGKDLLLRMYYHVEGISSAQSVPTLDGRRMRMVLNPRKRAR